MNAPRTAHTTTKPSTPLPWTTDHGTVIYSTERGTHRGAVAEYGYQQDAAYIVTACNAFPELVAALRDLTLRCDGDEGVRADGSNIQTHAAHAILAKLGEQ